MRLYYYCLVWNLCAIFVNSIEFCPSGTLIIEKGLKPEDEDSATRAHNSVRQGLVDGTVPGGPRAKFMKTMVYDQSLAHKAVPVTRQCANQQMDVKDRRWPCIGQNTYLNCNDTFDPDVDWYNVVDQWFSEYRNFVYPNKRINDQDVSHYRQLAWANSDTLGCDFALFINSNDITNPFCKLYVCNYAFCANNAANADAAPYDVVN